NTRQVLNVRLRHFDNLETTLQHDVIDLLKIETSDDVPVWLAALILDRCPGSSVRTLRVFPGAAARQKEELPEALAVSEVGRPGLPILPLVDAVMLQALCERDIHVERIGAGVRYVLPLYAGNEVRYAVDVVCCSTLHLPKIAPICQ